VLDRVERLLQPRPVAIGGHRDLALHDRRPGVDPLVDEVDGDAGRLDPRLERLADRVEAGEGGEQRRVDVDDAIAEAGDEGLAEQLHVASEDDEAGGPRLDPLGHRGVTRLAVGELGTRKDAGLHAGVPRPLQRPGGGLVGADADHLDPLAPVQRVEDRLQVGPRPGGQHNETKRGTVHLYVLGRSRAGHATLPVSSICLATFRPQ
jgi:hypothetical protein